jgi:hypothetical protein
MRFIVMITALLFLFTPSLAYADEREGEVVQPTSQMPQLIIKAVAAGVSGRSAYEYIELYNPNSQDVFLDSWTLSHLRKEGVITQSFTLYGTVKARTSVLLAGSDSELAALSPDFTLKANSIVTTGGILRLMDATESTVQELRWGDTVTGDALTLATGSVLKRRFSSGLPVSTGDVKQDFQTDFVVNYSPEKGGFIPYLAPVNDCADIFISEIAANVSSDHQFIELYNAGTDSVVLDGCLLQTNRSATKSYELVGTLTSGEYRAYMVAATELQLTKTTAGSVYLLASDGESETDVRSYESLSTETSWAWYETGDWRQTFTPTPNKANIWQEFLPCEVGYERAPDTERCRKIVINEEVVSECETGKYRNPETGRCKTIEVVDVVTPCRTDQYRSVDTNRCRSVTSATATLAPCKDNQERNTETNRCRVTASVVPAVDYSVEPTKEATSAFTGWWVLGGIGLLGLGYAGWEWRSELRMMIRKTGSFFQTGK